MRIGILALTAAAVVSAVSGGHAASVLGSEVTPKSPDVCVVVRSSEERFAQYAETLLTESLVASGFVAMSESQLGALRDDAITWARINDLDPTVLQEINEQYSVDFVVHGELTVDSRAVMQSRFEGFGVLSCRVVNARTAEDIGRANSTETGSITNPGPVRGTELSAEQAAVDKAVSDVAARLQLPACFPPDRAAEPRLTRVWSIRPEGRVNQAAFSPVGSELVVATDAGVKSYDVTTRSELHSMGPAASCLAFAPDGGKVAMGAASGQLHVWDRAVQTGSSFRTKDAGTISQLTFSPDSTQVAVGGPAGISLYAVATGTHLGSFGRGREQPKRVQQFALQFDWRAEKLRSVASDRWVREWSVAQMRETAAFEQRPDKTWERHEVRAGAFSLGANLVALGITHIDIDLWRRPRPRLDSEYICVYDAEDRLPVRIVHAHEEPVQALSFYPITPRYLASGSEDGQLCIWDLANATSTAPGRLSAAVFEARLDGAVTCVAFSSDGNWLAAASRGTDGKDTLTVWRLE
jgi:hypothetical protein